MTIDFDVVTKAFCGLNAISHVINNNYQSGDTIMKNYFTDSEDVVKYTKEAIDAFLMHLEAINVKASVDGHYTTVVVQPIAVMYKSIKLD